MMLVCRSWITILYIFQTIYILDGKKSITSVKALTAQSVKSQVGEDGLLTCIVTNQGQNTVIWKKDEKGKAGNKILSANDAVISSDKRISVLHEDDGEVYVLLIKNLTIKDSGFYVCEVNSDPPVRSFRKLIVSNKAQPKPKNVSLVTELVAPQYWHQPIQSIEHNFTQCCVDKMVPTTCLGFCELNSILGGSAGDPNMCEPDFGKIASCMADGRDHVPCCQAAAVPEVCQDLCRGEYTEQTDLLKTQFSCVEHTAVTLSCIAMGIESLPGTPKDMSVTALNDTSLVIRWNPPDTPLELSHQYVVNITYHQVLVPVYAVTVTSNEAKQFYPSHSQLYKVPLNTTRLVVSSLEVFSLYEVQMWTEGRSGGRSLPTYKEMVVTHLKGEQKEDKGFVTPDLPDIKSCCISKNVSHARCVDQFCDPLKMTTASVSDLMICAPWDTQIFSCLADGRDHSPCCARKSLPPLCQELCSGQVTDISFKYFKCLSYMDELSSCLLDGYGVLPSAPTNLRFSNVETNFGILHWDAPEKLAESVFQYVVSYQEMGKNMGERKELYNAESPFILENLNSSSSYEVYVMGMNSHGVGEESARIVFRTASRTITDLQEDSDTGYNQTQCCLNSQVKDACHPLCTYDAKFSDLQALHGQCSDDLSKILRCGVGGRDHLPCCALRGVPKQCQPLCQAVNQRSSATNYTACLPYIGQIYVCMEEGSTKLPESPRNLRAIAVTNTTATLMWNVEDKSGVDQFEVYYRKLYNNSDNTNIFVSDKQINTTSTVMKVTDLETKYKYTFYVVSRNQYGTSLPTSILKVNISSRAWAGETQFSTASPPHMLEVGGKSATFLQITWNPPVIAHPEDILSYKIFYRQAGPDQTAFKEVTSVVTSVRLEDLKPNTIYTVYAVTISRQADRLDKLVTSQASETLLAWTDPALPAFVEAPILVPSSSIKEGDNMTIICSASGSPTPRITFYMNGHPLHSEMTNRLATTVYNVTESMTQIACLADNGYGTPMQTSRNINIDRPPQIEAKMTFDGFIGDDLMIQCKVTSLNKPEINLFRNKGLTNKVSDDDRAAVHLAETDVQGVYMYSVVLKTVTQNDGGYYYCQAKNNLGEKVATLNVNIPHAIKKTIDATECCRANNVTSDCLDVCMFSIDFDDLLRKPQCFTEFTKIMFCASDGSDHRHCCKEAHVPDHCLNWCRGQPSEDETLCGSSHSAQILQCFHTGQDMLPSPPRNPKVRLTSNHSAILTWDKPNRNADKVELYRIYYREKGTRDSEIHDTQGEAYEIDNLESGKLYEIVLKAGNSKGTSHLTPPIVFATSNAVLIETSLYRAQTNLTAVIVFLVVFLVGGTVAVFLFVRRRNMCAAFKNKTQGTSVYFENPVMNLHNIHNLHNLQDVQTTIR